MKSATSLLLVQLCLDTIATAQQKTVVAEDPANYEVSLPTPPPVPTGNDITVLTDDGVNVFLGPDLSQKVIAAYDANCADIGSTTCAVAMQDALGVSPTADGIQKRFVPLVVAGVAIAIAVSIQWAINIQLWKSQAGKVYSPLSLHIPAAQTSLLQGLGNDNNWVYTPKTGEPGYTVTMTPQPTPEPSMKPTTEDKDGGKILHLPDMTDAIKEAYTHVVCKRDFEKTASCIAQFAESIVKFAQAGGSLANLAYIAPWDFPDPEEILLKDALAQVTDYSGHLYIGPSDTERLNVAEAATWVSWAYVNEEWALADDLAFSADLIKKGTTKSGGCTDGPAEQDTPYCSNCGGDQAGTTKGDAGDSRGKCVGFGGTYFRDCPCFIDEYEDGIGPSRADVDLAFQALLALPDIAPEIDPNAYDKICFKQQPDVRADKSKWKWGQRNTMKTKIDEFCASVFPENEFTGTYETGSRDAFQLHMKYTTPPTKEQCTNKLGDLVDNCDSDGVLNQHNVKWGGRSTMKASGNIFEVIPTEQRVSTSAVNWECNTWDNRDGKGGKGKDGQPLPEKTDDEMMKEQCEHQLYNIGWLKSSSCGNSYQITFTGSNGYASHEDCWNYNYACISDSINNQNGVVMTGTHWAGSAGQVKNYLGIRCWIGFDGY